MFSDEILEKIYSREELRQVDLATQVLVVRVIEEVLQEGKNDNEFQPDQYSE